MSITPTRARSGAVSSLPEKPAVSVNKANEIKANEINAVALSALNVHVPRSGRRQPIEASIFSLETVVNPEQVVFDSLEDQDLLPEPEPLEITEEERQVLG